MTEQKFLKVRIKGKLITLGELHIGGGGVKDVTITKRDNTVQNNTQQIQCLVKGINGKPYIPGSSIKGLLRSVGESLIGEKFWGKDDEASKLICFDAFSNAEAIIRSRTCIDPVTNTAKNHMLYSNEVITQGSEFEVEFLLKQVTEPELKKFLTLLNNWQGEYKFAIGKNKSIGYGLLKWQYNNKPVQFLTDKHLKNWLYNEDQLDIWDFADKALEVKQFINDIDISSKLADNYIAFDFSIKQDDSPLLINDPDIVDKQEKKPDLEYYRDKDNRPLIPGSTLKGALRAQMRKILLTLLYLSGKENNNFQQLADIAIAEIFGHTYQKSRINITDAQTNQYQTHEQYFNIIDRFSGETNNLYYVRAVINAVYTGTLLMHKDLPEWAKELLRLAFQDFKECDLVLGWGKAKGYGRCKLEVSDKDDFLKGNTYKKLSDKVKQLKESIRETANV